MATFKKIVIASMVFFVFLITFEISARYIFKKVANESRVDTSGLISLGKFVKEHLKNLKARGGNPKSDDLEIAGYLLSETAIEKNLDLFAENAIGIANSPYDQLITEKNLTIERDAKGSLKSKSSTTKYVRLLKSRIYNPWDPIIYNSPQKEENNIELIKFIDKYALGLKVQSTDENGYRTTVPRVTADKIVLVIGDSVAFGASLSDNETISSQLQDKFRQVRFINDSIGQGTARDNLERLSNQLQLLKDKIVGVIYVHTENDYTTNDTPQSIMVPLATLLNKHKIKYQALVHQVYIYQSMPDLFRGKFSFQFGNTTKLMGRDDNELLKFYRFKNETLEIARKNNIHTIDFYDIVDRYRHEKGTPFAGLSLYVDHAHFSREGVAQVVSKISETLKPFIEGLSL